MLQSRTLHRTLSSPSGPARVARRSPCPCTAAGHVRMLTQPQSHVTWRPHPAPWLWLPGQRARDPIETQCTRPQKPSSRPHCCGTPLLHSDCMCHGGAVRRRQRPYCSVHKRPPAAEGSHGSRSVSRHPRLTSRDICTHIAQSRRKISQAAAQAQCWCRRAATSLRPRIRCGSRTAGGGGGVDGELDGPLR
jgi:hypothetical protein